MHKFADHNFVELDFNDAKGEHSTIPEEIGPWVETKLGAVLNSSLPAGTMKFLSNAEFAAVSLTPSPNMEAAFASDRFQRFDASVGTFSVNPSNVGKNMRWTSPRKHLGIAFNSEAYAALASAELDGADWELRPPGFGHVDLRALRLARNMAIEISKPSFNELYLNSLLTVFGVHLIRNYATAKLKQANAQNRCLSLSASRRVLEYMNAHMTENLSVDAIAKVALMSPSHFIRAFSITFGMPPHKYLVSIRLQKAERLLLESKLPISAIAQQTGFSTQSHLTNAMMRLKQMTPGEIRKIAD